MKKIIWSSKKFGQLEILVDDEDYERVKKYPWGVLKCVSSDVLYVKYRNVDPLTYQASLGINTSKIRKTIYGGRFKTPEEAAIKYNELARIHHGEFAYQNPV